MLRKTINDIVIRIFEEASQGTLPLLGYLKQVLECSNIRLIYEHINKTTVSESFQDASLSFHALSEEPIFNTFYHPDIQLSESAPNQFVFTIDQQDEIYLVFLFQHHSHLKKSLESSDVIALLPHIKQAILLANQISEQQNDLYSIHYVMENYSWHNLNKLDAQQNDHLLASSKPANNKVQAPNIETEQLSHLFHFTPSETELTKLLLSGLSLQDIADHRNVSKQTIRKQLQAILKKAQCDSQEKLMLIMCNALMTYLPPSNRKLNSIASEIR